MDRACCQIGSHPISDHVPFLICGFLRSAWAFPIGRGPIGNAHPIEGPNRSATARRNPPIRCRQRPDRRVIFRRSGGSTTPIC